MMKGAVADVSEAIGRTPVVRLNRLTAGLEAEIYCKLEYLNPGGSLKDRVAAHLIDEAERRGDLVPGGTIVEATSGNTGTALAMLAALRGYKCVFVIPDKNSISKVMALRAAGAKVILTPADVDADDPRSHYQVARRVAEETPNAFFADQFNSPDNPQAHYRFTGPEIWEDCGGELDAFVAPIGTGGTLTGVGTFLKAQRPEIAVVGVDVVGSIYYDFWKSGLTVEPQGYKAEGIGGDFFPSTLNFGLIDEMYRLTDKAIFETTRALARLEGLYTGGSGGAAVLGAIRYAEQIRRPAKILVLLAESASRYYHRIFDDDWMRENGFLDPEEGLGTIRDLLGNKSPEVFTARNADTIRDVIDLMKVRGISQVPVLDDGQLVGIVTESGLLQALLEGGVEKLDEPIGSVMSDAYEVADPDAPVGFFNHIFNQGKVIIVWERGQVRGLITKIDVIDHLAHLRRSTR